LLDDRIRFALLKVAEITTTSTAEPVPGAVITLQTPIAEEPVLPKIRLNLPGSKSEDIPVRLILNPKKVKATPAQRTGLSESDLTAIQVALRKLVSARCNFRLTSSLIIRAAPCFISLLILSETMPLSKSPTTSCAYHQLPDRNQTTNGSYYRKGQIG
jgi:hypothetical protein